MKAKQNGSLKESVHRNRYYNALAMKSQLQSYILFDNTKRHRRNFKNDNVTEKLSLKGVPLNIKSIQIT
jgi:hypothetical protein